MHRRAQPLDDVFMSTSPKWVVLYFGMDLHESMLSSNDRA